MVFLNITFKMQHLKKKKEIKKPKFVIASGKIKLNSMILTHTHISGSCNLQAGEDAAIRYHSFRNT